MKYDLGKRRAEANRVPHTVDLDDHHFTMPAVLTGSVVSNLGGIANIGNDPSRISETVLEVYTGLFGAKDAEEAMQVVGVEELSEIISTVYGISLGESPASTTS